MVHEKTGYWSPETCGCSVFYVYDADRAPVDRVHTYISRPDIQALADRVRGAQGLARNIQPQEITCVVHEGLGGSSRLWEVLQEENTRKNEAVGVAIGVKAALTGEQVLWAWDESRVLQLSFAREAALTAQEKADIQAAANIQFGPGRIAVL